ncbi:Beta-1,2-xylosyltransferase [Thalictrum thalictroides]|uniref:Beta-1,2-xylosyltransferase n=1 Tax=Thalictrum thalictroides TaxID=46969 RepID=A0A7J6VXH8_THATH|nr:Beta-1,2-xylosyltransferase [Thalictrum thalictroides]
MMSSRRKGFLLKFLLFLFALNSISLFFYFSSNPALLFLHSKHSSTTKIQDTHSSSLTQNPQKSNFYFHGKPWPILPSYLPWTLNPNIHSKSCEGYFGNGFNQRIDVLKPQKRSVDGWFRCFYSETLVSSICEGGRIRMNLDKINMSMGGENLETVIGRGEVEELPNFKWGAFEIEVSEGIGKGEKGRKLVNTEFLDQYVPYGNVDRHTMRSLLDSIRLVKPDEFNCDEKEKGPNPDSGNNEDNHILFGA